MSEAWSWRELPPENEEFAEPAGDPSGRSPSRGPRVSGGAAAGSGELSGLLQEKSAAEAQTETLKVPEVSRQRLVLPVITILLISFLAIFAFLWSTARSLNTEAAMRDLQLANSLLASQALTLAAVGREHAIGAEAVRRLSGTPDVAWAERNLGQRMARDFGISSAWVIDPKGRTRTGFLDGRRTKDMAFDVFPNGLDQLIARARRLDGYHGGSLQGYLLAGDEIHMAVVSPVINSTNSGPAALAQAPVLVLTQVLDEGFLLRSGVNFTLDGLDISRAPAPNGYQGLAIRGASGGTIGFLVWQADRPGDGLLWPLSPALAAALIAIGYFLYLFVRGADLFMERQAYLAGSLQHEQNLRNLKSRFVSMVSHELRTPLAAIRSATEVLERYGERMTPEDRAEETHVIHKAVDALTKLVDNVLVIGRSDWMTGKGAARPLDLVELCHQIWSETVHSRDSKLLISEEGERRTFYGDVAALRALLSNLFSNAAKYSGGDVMVKILTRPKQVVVRVTDFGMGIPREELDGIFEPFRRAKNAEPMTGSGLGLSIARAAVKSMGGNISVMSELGRGTTFELTFPQERQTSRTKHRVEET